MPILDENYLKKDGLMVFNLQIKVIADKFR